MNNSFYLEQHFHSEHAGEHIVKVVEYGVPVRSFIYGILCGKCYTTGTDYDHDEQIKVSQVHYEVTKSSYSV